MIGFMIGFCIIMIGGLTLINKPRAGGIFMMDRESPRLDGCAQDHVGFQKDMLDYKAHVFSYPAPE